MYALSDESRQHLMRLSVMIVCGATAILPFTVAPTSPVARAQNANRAPLIFVPDVPGKLEFPSISVIRDPFVPDASPRDIDSGPSGMLPVAGSEAIGIVLPPNAGAAGPPPANTPGASTMPLLRGIVLGSAPQALMDFGSGVKVVSIGDSVGSETIRSIDAGGVTLSSGLHLRMSGTPR